MLTRSVGSTDCIGKTRKPVKTFFLDRFKKQMLKKASSSRSARNSPNLTSAIDPIMVGKDQRLFVAHQGVLSHSPLFAAKCQDQFFESNRSIHLPGEEPEIFSCVLKHVNKSDYSPRLTHAKRRNTWMLEGDAAGVSPQLGNTDGRSDDGVEATFFNAGANDHILRDTDVYCAAERYVLEELKRLSLRKQGSRSGIKVGEILRIARYAYENTPNTDFRLLRARCLELIIRGRKTFKRSRTMLMEMEMGGRLFFDLFCSMANYIDALENRARRGTPRSV